MKELSTEEKVNDGNYKTYTELINRLEDVKDAIKKHNYGIAMDMLCKPYPEHQITISPELKESEDERIRKEIIEDYCSAKRLCREGEDGAKRILDEKIAWLEKQGEKDEEILILKDQIESLHAAIKAVKETHRIELEKQGEREINEWKEGNIIRHDGILAIVLKGRRAMKSNGESFAVQYPDEWVKAAPNEIEQFFSEFEKLGDQNQLDKVEPKFHEGDWVVYCNNDVDLITGIEENGYFTNNGGYIPFVCESAIRFWTIQDAKDGDVLAYNDGSLTIFRYRLSGLDAGLYMSHVLLTDKIEFNQTCAINNVHPATKEQRDLLFQKMKEAGYEWDAEKKELIKIEHKLTEDVDLPEFESYLCLMFQKFRTKGMCTNGEIIDYVKEHSQKINGSSGKFCLE